MREILIQINIIEKYKIRVFHIWLSLVPCMRYGSACFHLNVSASHHTTMQICRDLTLPWRALSHSQSSRLAVYWSLPLHHPDSLKRFHCCYSNETQVSSTKRRSPNAVLYARYRNYRCPKMAVVHMPTVSGVCCDKKQEFWNPLPAASYQRQGRFGAFEPVLR